MLESAKWVASKIQEFIKRIGDLEDDSEETKKEVKHLRKEMEILTKGMAHTDKVNAHQGKTIADLEQRVKRLESKNHSLATTAGIAKKKIEKLKDERRTRH